MDVLTHEAGHAFAAWVAARKDLPMIPEKPGMESCEIHSMSMEFLTAEHHEKFFGTDTPRYELAHAEDAMYFLPYGTMVDEFQHIMYAEPDLTPGGAQRSMGKAGKRIPPPGWTSRACPSTDAARAGSASCTSTRCRSTISTTAWPKRWRCSSSPRFCTTKKDAPAAVPALVGEAGGKTYPGLVAAAGLDSPFAPGTLAKLGKEVGAWIAAQDAALNAR